MVGRAITVKETTGPFCSFPTEDFKVGHMIDAANLMILLWLQIMELRFLLGAEWHLTLLN